MKGKKMENIRKKRYSCVFNNKKIITSCFERMNDNVCTIQLPLNRYNKLPSVTNFRSETLSIILSGVSQLIQHNVKVYNVYNVKYYFILNLCKFK